MNKKQKIILSSALTILGTLSPDTIARAWRDPVYFASLSEEVRSQIPSNPAGDVQTDWRIDGNKDLTVMGTASNDCNTSSNLCNTSSNTCNTSSNDCNTSTSCNTMSSNCSSESCDSFMG